MVPQVREETDGDDRLAQDRHSGEAEERLVKERARELMRDERFAGYLARSFYSMRPLQYERRIQRNRAIVMAVLAVVVLLWVVYRFFL